MGIIVTALIVGLITGWLAGLVVGGIDQLRHIVVGILGSFLGEVVVENIGFPIGDPPLIPQIIFNAAGAIILIVSAHIFLRSYPP
jgi:uncharacterized membrane protein YeaQ/YmgE (transglycosylase-associated protein family)